MAISIKGPKGLSLVELLVAMLISAILIAALYRTFVRQQKTYVVQEQVVDTLQNARLAITRMMQEIRMAGFGKVPMILPNAIFGSKTLNNVLSANTPAGGLTIIVPIGQVTLTNIPASNQVTVSSLTNSQGNTLFDTGDRKYISIGGIESCAITNVDAGTKTLTLNGNLKFQHTYGDPDPSKNECVFALRAITYQQNTSRDSLERDENVGGTAETVAGPASAGELENLNITHITNLQFQYLDANGNVIADPVANAANIRVVRVSVTARTGMSDPDYKSGSGYRTRTITSNIQVRNMGL